MVEEYLRGRHDKAREITGRIFRQIGNYSFLRDTICDAGITPQEFDEWIADSNERREKYCIWERMKSIAIEQRKKGMAICDIHTGLQNWYGENVSVGTIERWCCEHELCTITDGNLEKAMEYARKINDEVSSDD